MSAVAERVVIRRPGLQPYESTWRAMQAFTDARTADTADELWCLEHPPVFTLGQAGRPEHLLDPATIPVVHSDRGGQVTYHGPGQLVVYLMVDIRRKELGARAQVSLIEQALLALLAHFGIAAGTRPKAPGVYVGEAKIAQLGLRIRRGASYHGLSLNVDMDLAPFARINPCGYAGLAVTRMADLLPEAVTVATVAPTLIDELCTRLGYTARLETDQPWIRP
jgi:lipoyl(octanoyl) transferase